MSEPPISATVGSRWSLASRRRTAKLVTIALSVALLYLLYRRVDLRGVANVLRQADPMWVAISLGVIVPITIARALRFMWMMPRGALRGPMDAIHLTLISSALNVFLPAKTGDFAKSVIVAGRGGTTPGLSVAVVVYERLSDLVGMLAWCVTSYLLVRPVSTILPPVFWFGLAAAGILSGVMILSEGAAALLLRGVHSVFDGTRFHRVAPIAEAWPTLLVMLRGRRLWLALFSIALWFAQLFQIWLFTVAVNVEIPFAVCASLAAISLLVAQLPVTFGGIGARDVALVLLLAPYMAGEEAAAVGILTALRGLLMPVAALPLIRVYLYAALRAGALPGATNTNRTMPNAQNGPAAATDQKS